MIEDDVCTCDKCSRKDTVTTNNDFRSSNWCFPYTVSTENIVNTAIEVVETELEDSEFVKTVARALRKRLHKEIEMPINEIVLSVPMRTVSVELESGELFVIEIKKVNV